LRHAGTNTTPVQFDLGLTGTTGTDAFTARGTTTALPGHGIAPAAEPGQQVLERSEFTLGLALPRRGVLGEDVKEQRGPVDDLDLDDVLEGAPLGGCKFGINDDRVRAARLNDLAEFLGLARPQESPRIGLEATLDQAVAHLRPGGL